MPEPSPDPVSWAAAPLSVSSWVSSGFPLGLLLAGPLPAPLCVQAPGADSAGEEESLGLWGSGFLSCYLSNPAVRPSIQPARGHPWAAGGAPGSALPLQRLKICSETKTRLCFNFPPVLPVIVQKASI